MMQRYRLTCLLAGALLATPALAPAQTTWTAGSGDWGTGSNWSAGEPTAGVDAIINTTAMATVTLAGETCRSLLLGSSGGALLDITGGSLTVDNATVGMGAPNFGASINIGSGSSAVFSVAHSLTIGPLADVVTGGGTFMVGTTASDSLVVQGTLQLMNSTTTVTNLSMRDGSVLSAFVQFNGLTGVVVTGTAVLNGTLKVFDFSAPDGVYELISAGSIVGTFDGEQLPASGDWSWMIDGNKVIVMKGAVPVEPTTWSGIKSGGYRQ